MKTLLPLNIQLFSKPGEGEITIDELFTDPAVTPPANENDPNNPTEPDLTQAMINRINQVKSKTEKEVQERIAKELGFENYAAIQKAIEEDLIKKHGYNPEDIDKVLEPLLQKRLADDPRLQKLEALEARERESYIAVQLKEINTVTGQNITQADLSQETLDLWAKGVDLSKAYYAVQGNEIITKNISQLQNGDLTHLAPANSGTKVKVRGLTNAEKDIYRSIIPGITEEELNKKTTPIK